MKIFSYLSEEYLGKRITDGEKVLIVANDDQGDIVIADEKAQAIVPMSKKLIDVEWELVPLKGFERLAKDQKYYYIDANSLVSSNIETNTLTDEVRYNNANYFSTEEAANKIKEVEFLNRYLLRVQSEDNIKIDWDDLTTKKYYIGIDFEDDAVKVFTTTCFSKTIGIVYFSNEKLAQLALEGQFDRFKKLYA